jgi:hypothetical protein
MGFHSAYTNTNKKPPSDMRLQKNTIDSLICFQESASHGFKRNKVKKFLFLYFL